jgi:hypothetical protein
MARFAQNGHRAYSDCGVVRVVLVELDAAWGSICPSTSIYLRRGARLTHRFSYFECVGDLARADLISNASWLGQRSWDVGEQRERQHHSVSHQPTLHPHVSEPHRCPARIDECQQKGCLYLGLAAQSRLPSSEPSALEPLRDRLTPGTGLVQVGHRHLRLCGAQYVIIVNWIRWLPGAQKPCDREKRRGCP